MNNMNKNLGIGLVLAIVLVLGMTFPRGNTVVQQVRDQVVGAVASVDTTEDHFSYNGFEQSMYTRTMSIATSTVCVVKTPAATSTLVAYYANFSVAPTVGTTFVLGTSTTPFSTSSPIFSGVLAANVKNTISWLATTTAVGAQNKTIGANTYIVFDLAGSPTYSGLVGKCYAEFRTFK